MKTEQISFRVDSTLVGFIRKVSEKAGVSSSSIFRAACESGLPDAVRSLASGDDENDAEIDSIAEKLESFYHARDLLDAMRSEALDDETPGDDNE